MAQAALCGGRLGSARLVEAVDPVQQLATNVLAFFEADGQGGGVLDLAYRGPLTGHDPIWVRVGVYRCGAALRVRDAMMAYRGPRACARLPVAPGGPLEAAWFAFFTRIEDGRRELWDNAGRPFGRYQLDPATGSVVAA